jgi:hypothetical protein
LDDPWTMTCRGGRLTGRPRTTGEAINARGALPFAMTGPFFFTSFLTLGGDVFRGKVRRDQGRAQGVFSDTDLALNALHSLSEAPPDLALRPFDLIFSESAQGASCRRRWSRSIEEDTICRNCIARHHYVHVVKSRPMVSYQQRP